MDMNKEDTIRKTLFAIRNRIYTPKERLRKKSKRKDWELMISRLKTKSSKDFSTTMQFTTKSN